LNWQESEDIYVTLIDKLSGMNFINYTR